MSRYQIFISYAHVDNFPKNDYRWVSSFVQDLEHTLAQKLGHEKKFKIWFDKYSLQGNAKIKENIDEKINKSDILLIVFSTGYLNSSWCDKERKLFIENNKDNQNIYSNIFTIHLEDIESEKRPEEIGETLGFNFWYLDKEKGTTRQRASKFVISEKIIAEYFNSVEDVALAIKLYLKTIEEKQEKLPQKRGKIFLALLELP